MGGFIVRTWHRRVAITLAVFLLVQGLAGLYLAFLPEDHVHNFVRDIHGGWFLGGLHKIHSFLVGGGVVFMAITGIFIFIHRLRVMQGGK